MMSGTDGIIHLKKSHRTCRIKNNPSLAREAYRKNYLRPVLTKMSYKSPGNKKKCGLMNISEINRKKKEFLKEITGFVPQIR